MEQLTRWANNGTIKRGVPYAVSTELLYNIIKTTQQPMYCVILFRLEICIFYKFMQFTIIIHMYIGETSILSRLWASSSKLTCIIMETTQQNNTIQAVGSILVSFYDSHDYGGGIPSRLHKKEQK
jgi:hypothetical protein